MYEGKQFASIKDSFVPIESSESKSPFSETMVIVIAVAAALVGLALIVAVAVVRWFGY